MSENCGREQDTIFLVLLCDKICYLPTYRKLPKISPGAYVFQRPFLRGLFLEGLIYGGRFAFQNRSGQPLVERKFTVFALFYFVLRAISKYKPPGRLIFGGAI